MSNPLASILKVVDFALFRELLERKLLNAKKRNNAGAKPYDLVLLFKILIRQRYYGLHPDSAYTGKEQDKIIAKYKMKNKVTEKGYRNNPLTDKQKASNTAKSKIRARVEHVFGSMEQSRNGLVLKSVGRVSATGIIGLINTRPLQKGGERALILNFTDLRFDFSVNPSKWVKTSLYLVIFSHYLLFLTELGTMILGDRYKL